MAIAGAYRGVGKVREQDAVVLHGMHAPYGLICFDLSSI